MVQSRPFVVPDRFLKARSLMVEWSIRPHQDLTKSSSSGQRLVVWSETTTRGLEWMPILASLRTTRLKLSWAADRGWSPPRPLTDITQVRSSSPKGSIIQACLRALRNLSDDANSRGSFETLWLGDSAKHTMVCLAALFGTERLVHIDYFQRSRRSCRAVKTAWCLEREGHRSWPRNAQG